MPVLALVLAAALLGGVGLLVLQRRDQARSELVADASRLARERTQAFERSLTALNDQVDLYASTPAIAAYAKASDRGALTRVVKADAEDRLDDARRISRDMVGTAAIVDPAGRARLLRSAADAEVSGTLPVGSRTLSVNSGRYSVTGKRLLIVSSPIVIVGGRTRLSFVLIVPVDQMLSQGLTPGKRLRTQLLADYLGQVLSVVPRQSQGADASNSERVATHFAANSDAPTAEIDGQMWGFQRVPDTKGRQAYEWWFVAVRPVRSASGLTQDVGLSGLLMILVSLGVGAAGLRALRIRRRALELTAGTDQLTGIANRRAMLRDLEEAESRREPVRLAMFDLNGFKEYNDTFGHQAGDALLRRVAVALQEAVAPARAYRLGGDEFCVVSPVEVADELESRAALALTEHGPGFKVDSSWGSVAFPAEAPSINEALSIADERMYHHKRSGRGGALAQTKAALRKLVAEADPELAEHQDRVADLAEQVARVLALPEQLIGHLRSAAELHDVGMLAIPESIREKVGSLDEHEQEFVHRHTVIGERVLNAADSLHTAAAIVRASHEHWDGEGYPAKMQGDDIPLAARIILACDAYDTMTHRQPYRPAMSADAARAELRKGTDRQFDSEVVAALEQVLDRPRSEVVPVPAADLAVT